MNKFVILAFVAMFATMASAYVEPDEPITEAKIVPTDEEEVASLAGPAKVFEPFCISTRDQVLGEIKVGSNEAAAGVFNTFFKSAGEVAAKVIDTQKEATKILGAQLADPDAKIDGAVDKIIIEGQEAIKEGQTQPRGIFEAVKTMFKASAGAFGASVAEKLDGLSIKLDHMKVLNGIYGMCKIFSLYNERIDQEFISFRDELTAAGRTDVADLKRGDVPCVTAQRISRLDSFCNLFAESKEPLAKLYRGY